ncbi:MAG: amidohydrolase [Flammeovirgaceae bacterium]|nr:amidohydrolase [Flammeovirgaceae bacterium]
MKKKYTIFLLLFIAPFISMSQEGFPVNGVNDNRENHYAFINANIIIDYKTKLENGILVIKDGVIESVGKDVSIPQGIRIFDLGGNYIYPSFIDLYTDYGIIQNEPLSSSTSFGSSYTNPQMLSNKNGPFSWNESIRPEYNSVENIKFDLKKSDQLRNEGFGAVVSHNMDGIMRGTGSLVSLANDVEQNIIIQDKASNHFSFMKGSSRQRYPSSLMGAVALLKQSFFDAEWYSINADKIKETNLSLSAIVNNNNLPKIIEVRDKLRILLAQKIEKEIGTKFIIKGEGDEYQRIKEIKDGNSSLIVPINYPNPYNVDDPFKNKDILLSQLKHWELAPSNPFFLENNDIDFSITTNGLKNLSDFRINLIKSLNRGASKAILLKALTYNPSKFLNMEKKLGSLNKSFIANFFIADGDIFSEDTKILSNWVQGKWHKVNDTNIIDFTGDYILSIDRGKNKDINNISLNIYGDKDDPKAKISIIKLSDSVKADSKIFVDDENISLTFSVNENKEENLSREYKLSGFYSNGKFIGKGTLNNTDWFEWTAVKISSNSIKIKKNSKVSINKEEDIGDVIYPFVEYGSKSIKSQKRTLIKGAKIWTLENDGVIEKGDVLIDDGKIVDIGLEINLKDKNIEIIDGNGLHLTPGIIDEHSHIALFGVNEGSQSNTAEVRMKDVVNSEDINIYRQLAGGVTASQLLHGSANAIGGQSAIVKFRWGSSPEEMIISEADEYIKFALGENVKRSRATSSTRFPDTRMGVEQVFVNAFNEAKIYESKWKNYNALSKKEKVNAIVPRKDIELDALTEILNGKMHITCHSYVQSEINMLMKVAEKFDFKVNTFTHILEGYKVADIMAGHGAGGASFADWWAFKNEVKEAIPYNAALMSQAGVVTAINSDNREMARRLNQEAGKTIKYGNMSEIEAMKLVTINPAKLLNLDHRMGSIKVGKDADLVLWNDHPLSIYSKPLKTIVDGKVYYDIEEDKKLRDEIKSERARIISKMKNSNISVGSRRKPIKTAHFELTCEDEYDYQSTLEN